VHSRYFELYRMKTDRHWLHQKLVGHARQHGIKDAARVFGCSRNTVRKWWRRYQPGKPSSLAERSRRPHRCPHQTPSPLEGVVVRLRRQTGFGAERLKMEFALLLGVSAIQRIVRAHGLVRPRPKKHARKKQLRQIKKTWPLFGQLVADTRYLQDIPHYWPLMTRLRLPRFQYTVREVVSGLCLVGYADELSKSYTTLLAERVSAHLAWHGVDLTRVVGRPTTAASSSKTNSSVGYRRRCGRWAATTATSRPRRTPGNAMSRPRIGWSRMNSLTVKAFGIEPSSGPRPPPIGITSIWPDPIAAKNGSRLTRSFLVTLAELIPPLPAGKPLTSPISTVNTSPAIISATGVTIYPSIPFQGSIGEVSKVIAREVAEKKRVEALEGRLVERPVKAPLLDRHDTEKDQFSDAAGEYMAYYQQNHKPSSTDRWRSALLHLCAAFGSKRLDEISPFLMESYKAERKDAGAADATVNRELACLRNLYNMGMKWGWVRDNPVAAGKVSKFRENNGRDRFVTLEEQAALLEHCDQRLSAFVIRALDTGFRAGELQSLRWQDVDFQRHSVSVASGYTKNGDPRTNPMRKGLERALREWKIASNGNGAGLVFGPYRYREPFERARDKAGLGKEVVFHTLRHTYISRLVSAGVDIRTVQELAGHKTIGMTMRYRETAQAAKNLKPNSLIDEEGRISALLREFSGLETKRLTDITEADCQRWYGRRLRGVPA
jgi:integrase/transposase-like protein